MIGRTIQSPASFSWGPVVSALAAVMLLGLSLVAGNIHWAVAALFPGLSAALLWRSRRAAFSAEFTETALVVESPALSLAYDAIKGLRAPGLTDPSAKQSSQWFPIQVWHSEGVLEIPARLNVPSAEVYQFLLGRSSPRGGRDVNPILTDYLRRNEDSFGADRVWSYRARIRLRAANSHRGARAFFLALLLSGLIWVIVAVAATNCIGWLGAGIPAIFFGGLLYLSLRLDKTGPVKNWRNASLVISPVGLALVQGDMQGEMRWDELRDVRLSTKGHRSFELSSRAPGREIVLTVEGAKIYIADIYDRPLSLIYENIQRYWLPGGRTR